MSTLSIKIGAVLDSSFNGAILGITGQLFRLGATIKELGSSMNSITRFKKLSTDLATSKKSWISLTKQARSLAKEVQATGKPTKTLVSQLNKANLAATKAKEAFLKKQEALHKMSQGIKDSGRDIRSFINSQSKLEHQLAG
ncbi:MAG: hypothetical protein PG981_001481 [Wolbachia endosymbiont of Ctenocephalides orientis wCori]|nr:MAG: hypothetical protein PG981_001481 [Wolbachia endosymbiont of Ctenocephalides orientis wCori]